ncbi:RICIN domain-containing protein [Streptomyces sp. NPDC017254]|uniref:RICIN domain-containing protein n=1 Tax=unclassified Streptomyces TaxID=2593676 RepID=UPI0037AD88B0
MNLRKTALRAFAGLAGFILSFTLVQPASADASTGGPTRIINRASGKCLEVADWSLDNGAPVRQWDCTGGDNQRWWVVDPDGVNQFTLVNVHSGRCVDIPNGNVANGVQLIQWTCHYNFGEDDINQRFYRLPGEGVGPVYYFAWSSFNIEIGGFSNANGAPAQLWKNNGGSNQRWYAGD